MTYSTKEFRKKCIDAGGEFSEEGGFVVCKSPGFEFSFLKQPVKDLPATLAKFVTDKGEFKIKLEKK